MSINAHLEVLQGKLKTHHSNLGSLRSKEASVEQKRVCRMLGLLTEEDENLVKSLTEPLPLAAVEIATARKKERMKNKICS